MSASRSSSRRNPRATAARSAARVTAFTYPGWTGRGAEDGRYLSHEDSSLGNLWIGAAGRGEVGGYDLGPYPVKPRRVDRLETQEGCCEVLPSGRFCVPGLSRRGLLPLAELLAVLVADEAEARPARHAAASGHPAAHVELAAFATRPTTAHTVPDPGPRIALELAHERAEPGAQRGRELLHDPIHERLGHSPPSGNLAPAPGQRLYSVRDESPVPDCGRSPAQVGKRIQVPRDKDRTAQESGSPDDSRCVPQPVAATAASSDARLRVLLVEDSATARAIVRVLLAVEEPTLEID